MRQPPQLGGGGHRTARLHATAGRDGGLPLSRGKICAVCRAASELADSRPGSGHCRVCKHRFWDVHTARRHRRDALTTVRSTGNHACTGKSQASAVIWAGVQTGLDKNKKSALFLVHPISIRQPPCSYQTSIVAPPAFTASTAHATNIAFLKEFFSRIITSGVISRPVQVSQHMPNWHKMFTA